MRNFERESELRREENMKLHGRIDGYEVELKELRAVNAQLRRRIRLAQRTLLGCGDRHALDAWRVLDLRKPLRPARKAGRK